MTDDGPYAPPVPRAPRGAAAAPRAAEGPVERHPRLLLAEDAHQDRFRRTATRSSRTPRPHRTCHRRRPAMNAPSTRATCRGRAVRGARCAVRGAPTVIGTAALLAPAPRVEVISAADDAVRDASAAADRDGVLLRHGFVPDGRALAGLTRCTTSPPTATRARPRSSRAWPVESVRPTLAGDGARTRRSRRRPAAGRPSPGPSAHPARGA